MFSVSEEEIENGSKFSSNHHKLNESYKQMYGSNRRRRRQTDFKGTTCHETSATAKEHQYKIDSSKLN